MVSFLCLALFLRDSISCLKVRVELLIFRMVGD